MFPTAAGGPFNKGELTWAVWGRDGPELALTFDQELIDGIRQVPPFIIALNNLAIRAFPTETGSNG